MDRFALFLLTGLASAFLVAPAHAQLARTYVSAVVGNDDNDCNRLTPCRTFQGAHDKTLAQGEITVLDPGGYGAVTITKAISIINDGVGEAGILVSGGGRGITISAGASDTVSLRGITIKGIDADQPRIFATPGNNGIVFYSGRALAIENCVVRSFISNNPFANPRPAGINFAPFGSSTLAVSDTVVTDSTYGIIVGSQARDSDVITATLSRVGLYNNGFGFEANGSLPVTRLTTITATIADSIASNNGVGVAADPGQVTVTITRSTIAGNSTGLRAEALVRIGETTISGNGDGWIVPSGIGNGAIQSYGDNRLAGNRANEGPMPVIPTK